MLQYPHKPTVIQALGALLNMSVSPELREEMGRRGAVHGLLGSVRYTCCCTLSFNTQLTYAYIV